MKKIFKKVFHVLLFVMLLAGVFLGYQYIQYKNKEVNDLQREIQKNVEEVICNEVLKQSEENFEKISCISVDYTDSNFVASVNFKN